MTTQPQPNTTGRFAKRNAGTINRRQHHEHNAHVTAWIWSEERALACGYIA